MNNIILRKLNVTDTWQPLASAPGPESGSLVGTVTISTPPTNSGNVLFRVTAEPAHEVPWVPGEWHELRRIDLSTVQIKAASGDGSGSIVTVVGGTW